VHYPASGALPGAAFLIAKPAFFSSFFPFLVIYYKRVYPHHHGTPSSLHTALSAQNVDASLSMELSVASLRCGAVVTGTPWLADTF
jgi:hypothetical protein